MEATGSQSELDKPRLWGKKEAGWKVGLFTPLILSGEGPGLKQKPSGASSKELAQRGAASWQRETLASSVSRAMSSFTHAPLSHCFVGGLPSTGRLSPDTLGAHGGTILGSGDRDISEHCYK